MEEDWEMVDYNTNTPSVDSSSKMGMGMGRWVVNVGKKVVIAGLVVPFVPCLVVILALGLACSVPYGVVFVSYACTQKLMSKLLPPHPSPSEYHELEEEQEQPHKEIRVDHQVIIDEEDNDAAVEVEDAAGVNEQVEQKEKEEEVDYSEKKQLPHFDVDKNQTKELGQQHKNSEEAEKIITEVDKSKEVEKIDDKKQQQQRSKESAGKRRKSKGKKMAAELPPEKESKGGGGGVVVSSTVKVEEDDSGVRVKYTESTVIAAADVNGKAAGGGGELKQEKPVAGALKSQDQKLQEESFSDEKIWEKIDGMREISGFNAPKRDSYFEELKALYLFTGIEAPATSTADTPAEFYTKLAFLMSVIGLK